MLIEFLGPGHVYNKIGTYQVATMAKQHNIPFYVAAPLSTFDMKSNPEDVVLLNKERHLKSLELEIKKLHLMELM